MEGGAANVVIFLIEAAARAGARDMGDAVGTGGSSISGSGGGGGRSSGLNSTNKRGGYFVETVDYVAMKAKAGLERAREAQRQSVSVGRGRGGASGSSSSSSRGRRELMEKEEACLTLLQGLSGFTRC